MSTPDTRRIILRAAATDCDVDRLTQREGGWPTGGPDRRPRFGQEQFLLRERAPTGRGDSDRQTSKKRRKTSERK